MPLWDKQRHFLVLGAIVAFHLLLISIQVPRGNEKTYFERSVFTVFSPLQKAAASAVRAVKSVWADYVSLRGVRLDNQNLRKENFFLSQDKKFLEDRLLLFQTEAQIRESLTRFRAGLITARVIGADVANPYRSLILDKGRIDGVRKDMAVCDRFGNLVGRTVEPISQRETMVQLITDKESSVSVESETSKVTGILSGQSLLRCNLNYIPSSSGEVKVGEDVITSGFDKIYPAGIRAGRIMEIEKPPGIFLVIKVQPYFNYSTLEAVGILPAVGEGGK